MLPRIRLTCGTLFDGKDNITSIDSIQMIDQFPNGQSGETSFYNVKQLLCWVVSAASFKARENGPRYTQFCRQICPVFQTHFLLVQKESHLPNDIWITVEQTAHKCIVIQTPGGFMTWKITAQIIGSCKL